jgi:hypothetical protein
MMVRSGGSGGGRCGSSGEPQDLRLEILVLRP